MRRRATMSASWVVALLAMALAIFGGCAVDVDPSAAEEAPPSVGGKADGQRVLDPSRSYEDRIELVRVLQRAHPYPGQGVSAWPDGREGFVTQTQWQLRSGRATRSGSNTLWGWWPNINYTLMVWQITALQERGELRDVHVVRYLDDDLFGAPREAIRAAQAYYDELDTARADVAAGRIAATQLGARQARLQQKLWDFHAVTVRTGLGRNRELLDKIPWPERRFSQAFGYTVVEMLATMNFPIDGEHVRPLNEMLLPDRIVEARDFNPLASSDLPATQRAGVVALTVLDEFENQTDRLILRTLRDFVTTADAAREAANRLLEALRTGDLWGLIAALGG